MNYEAIQQSIRTELERARAAWTAYALQIDYENHSEVVLADTIPAYVKVDILYYSAEQLSLGPNPTNAAFGQIILAAGARVGTGTSQQLKLLSHFTPYLQERDTLGAGVRTHVSQPYPAKEAKGFYYIPLVTDFWVVAQAPAVP